MAIADFIPKKSLKQKLILPLQEVIFPPVCVGCHKEVLVDYSLCPECWSQMPWLVENQCQRCGNAVLGDFALDIPCDDCLREPPKWDQLRAVAAYKDLASRLILRFKHGDREDLARPLARWMIHRQPEILTNAELLVPIPIHWTRKLSRKYNQAERLAFALSQHSDIPVCEAISRHKRTRSQKKMNPEERGENLAGAFSPARGMGDALRGKRVVLIDDVKTSGATLNTAAELCREMGASQINALCFAMVAREL